MAVYIHSQLWREFCFAMAPLVIVQSIPSGQPVSVCLILVFRGIHKDKATKERQEKNPNENRILFSYFLILLLYCVISIPLLTVLFLCLKTYFHGKNTFIYVISFIFQFWDYHIYISPFHLLSPNPLIHPSLLSFQCVAFFINC